LRAVDAPPLESPRSFDGNVPIVRYGLDAGIIAAMSRARKVTVELPDDLLRRAQKSTGDGITSTIRRGLELVAAGDAYRSLRRLKGKMAFSVDLDTLRSDQK
jgi:hypothetical protein